MALTVGVGLAAGGLRGGIRDGDTAGDGGYDVWGQEYSVPSHFLPLLPPRVGTHLLFDLYVASLRRPLLYACHRWAGTWLVAFFFVC